MQESRPDKAQTAFNNIYLPDTLTLKRLAVSESGFVFDPATGHSFNVNETGMIILHHLQQQKNIEQIMECLLDDYQIDRTQLERDLLEFIGLLRKQIKDVEE